MDTLAENHSVELGDRAHPSTPARERHGMRRILVCLDQSQRSERCLPCAAFLAETMGATLTLLHVMEPPHESWRANHAFDPVGWEIARREASAYLQRCEEQAAAASGGPVESRLEEGPA